MKLAPYAELHCLSNYSFLRGASFPEEHVDRCCHSGESRNPLLIKFWIPDERDALSGMTVRKQ